MSGPFKLSPLPYEENALDPAISEKTIGFHYNKHHKAYVETLNKLVPGTRYAEMKLEDIVRATHGASDPKDKNILQQRRPSLEPRFLLAQPFAETHVAWR